jgi:hypothetical protein
MDLVSHELERMKHRRTRNNRQKIIKKRKRIVPDEWRSLDNDLLKYPGKLAKWNLTCNCPLCKSHRWTEKAKYRQEAARWQTYYPFDL